MILHKILVVFFFRYIHFHFMKMNLFDFIILACLKLCFSLYLDAFLDSGNQWIAESPAVLTAVHLLVELDVYTLKRLADLLL